MNLEQNMRILIVAVLIALANAASFKDLDPASKFAVVGAMSPSDARLVNKQFNIYSIMQKPRYVLDFNAVRQFREWRCEALKEYKGTVIFKNLLFSDLAIQYLECLGNLDGLEIEIPCELRDILVSPLLTNPALQTMKFLKVTFNVKRGDDNFEICSYDYAPLLSKSLAYNWKVEKTVFFRVHVSTTLASLEQVLNNANRGDKVQVTTLNLVFDLPTYLSVSTRIEKLNQFLNFIEEKQLQLELQLNRCDNAEIVNEVIKIKNLKFFKLEIAFHKRGGANYWNFDNSIKTLQDHVTIDYLYLEIYNYYLPGFLDVLRPDKVTVVEINANLYGDLRDMTFLCNDYRKAIDERSINVWFRRRFLDLC